VKKLERQGRSQAGEGRGGKSTGKLGERGGGRRGGQRERGGGSRG